MSKSILIFCPVLGPFGGTETHIAGIASALAQEGWIVRVAALRSSLNRELVQEMVTSGVRFAVFPESKFFWLLLQPCNVLYTNSQGNASPLIWRLKGTRQRGFHHVHTSACEIEQGSWPPRYKAFISVAPRLVACSETTQRNLVEAGATGSTTYLPYLAPGSATTSRATSRTDRSRPWKFAFLGRLVNAKGVHLILQAAESGVCDGIQWHFYGDGECLGDLKASNASNVFLHGAFVGPDALQRILQSVDAVVLPSLHTEGMPLSLLECMSHGIPWVATDMGGTRELATGLEDCFIVQKGDLRAFIEAVCLLRDRLDHHIVSESAIRGAFDARFSSRAVVPRWLAYLNSLVQFGP